MARTKEDRIIKIKELYTQLDGLGEQLFNNHHWDLIENKDFNTEEYEEIEVRLGVANDHLVEAVKILQRRKEYLLKNVPEYKNRVEGIDKLLTRWLN